MRDPPGTALRSCPSLCGPPHKHMALPRTHAAARPEGAPAGLPPRPFTSMARPPSSVGWVGQPPSSLAVPLAAATQQQQSQLQRHTRVQVAPRPAPEQARPLTTTTPARAAGLGAGPEAAAGQQHPRGPTEQQQLQQALGPRDRPASATGSSRRQATAAGSKGKGRVAAPCPAAHAAQGVAGRGEARAGSGDEGGEAGLAVPEEVLRMAQQFSGSEGVVRPRTASPSAMQVGGGRGRALSCCDSGWHRHDFVVPVPRLLIPNRWSIAAVLLFHHRTQACSSASARHASTGQVHARPNSAYDASACVTIKPAYGINGTPPLPLPGRPRQACRTSRLFHRRSSGSSASMRVGAEGCAFKCMPPVCGVKDMAPGTQDVCTRAGISPPLGATASASHTCAAHSICSWIPECAVAAAAAFIPVQPSCIS